MKNILSFKSLFFVQSSTSLQPPTVSNSYRSSPISPMNPHTMHTPENLGSDAFGGNHLKTSPFCSSDSDVIFNPVQTPPSIFDGTIPPDNWKYMDYPGGADLSTVPVPNQTGQVWPNVRTATAPQVISQAGGPGCTPKNLLLPQVGAELPINLHFSEKLHFR